MSRIHALYRVHCAAAEIEAVAQALALEQSVETPRAVVRDAFVAREVLAQVEGIEVVDDGTFDVTLGLSVATTGNDVAQTLNMLYGNSSLHAHVQLRDALFADDFAARFGGPRFGIAGLRAAVGVPRRPLTCAALKPQGLPVAALAELCHTFALAGIDIIKDDHGLADQDYSPFAARVHACQQAVHEANRQTGRSALYAPSLVGSPEALLRQVRVLHDEGVGAALIAPALVGMPVFHELVAEHLHVPVLAHPAWAGATRVAPAFLLGKWFRMLGADAVIFPNHGGRFAYTPETCAAIAAACHAPHASLRAALPVPAGGMTVERTGELIEFYGADVMLLIGGALLAAGDALAARAREFVAQVEACAVAGVAR